MDGKKKKKCPWLEWGREVATFETPGLGSCLLYTAKTSRFGVLDQVRHYCIRLPPAVFLRMHFAVE